jgi:hypothetical protein
MKYYYLECWSVWGERKRSSFGEKMKSGRELRFQGVMNSKLLLVKEVADTESQFFPSKNTKEERAIILFLLF